MDEEPIRGRLRDALGMVRPLVTMSRDGPVLTALEWGVERPAAYATATAVTREGALELREQGAGTVPANRDCGEGMGGAGACGLETVGLGS